MATGSSLALIVWRNVLQAPIGASAGGDSDSDDEGRSTLPFDRGSVAREDLPYKVELWDAAKNSVEQVLAVTANGSIGYAAYYAAAREYPDRYVTLRHRSSIVARSNPPRH